jgi:uncharacterized protein (TIGR01777 family)
MKVTIVGATGLIGARVVAALRQRGDEVTVLSRDAERASKSLDVPAEQWNPLSGPAPTQALGGRHAVLSLAGEPVAQRWTPDAREKIRSSRVYGTTNVVEGLAATPDDARPRVLVSASASGFYGDRGDEVLDERAGSGSDFLAEVCRAWEAAADAARGLGVRVVQLRTGFVLDGHGGALAKMLLPFKAGVGGPVAGGRQYMSWIHLDDMVGLYLAALDGDDWSGPVNGCAPDAVTNAAFSHALGHALHRPSSLPVPGFAIRALYGEMAEIVTGGQRMVPARAQELGYRWAFTDLDQALGAALGR